MLNDVMLCSSWRTVSSWGWRDRSHINEFESRSYLRAIVLRAPTGDMRFVHAVDSSVTFGAFAKGRTSSRRLLPLVKKGVSLQVAAGLYPATYFCRTRPLAKALTRKPRDCLPLSPACACGNVLEFDQTLGYPGEGPPLAPRNKWDLARAAARGGVSLGEGRPVLDRTQKNRKELLEAFGAWLGSVGTSLSDLLDARPLDAEIVAGFLTRFGRQLFESGRPYWHYAETINAVAASRPSLRRGLQGAWDFSIFLDCQRTWHSSRSHAGHHIACHADRLNFLGLVS